MLCPWIPVQSTLSGPLIRAALGDWPFPRSTLLALPPTTRPGLLHSCACVCFHIFRNELYPRCRLAGEHVHTNEAWETPHGLVALQTAEATGVELRAQGGSHESTASLWRLLLLHTSEA